MTYTELINEVQMLRKLVDSLCVAAIDPRSDPNEERIRLGLRSPAGSYGYRLLRDGIGQAALDELEYKKQILIEDFPNLKMKK